MKVIRLDECDTDEEKCAIFNDLYANLELLNGKIEQLEAQGQPVTMTELTTPEAPTSTPTPKKKGMCDMRSLVLIVGVFVLALAMAYGAYDKGDINYEIASNPELLQQYLRDVVVPAPKKTVTYLDADVASRTLLTNESGNVFVVLNDTDGVTIQLPAVGAGDDGCYYTIVDANETAASDVTVEPGTGDTINGAAANVGFSSDGADVLPCGCTFIYNHDTTNWEALPQELNTAATGAWDSDSS